MIGFLAGFVFGVLAYKAYEYVKEDK